VCSGSPRKLRGGERVRRNTSWRDLRVTQQIPLKGEEQGVKQMTPKYSERSEAIFAPQSTMAWHPSEASCEVSLTLSQNSSDQTFTTQKLYGYKTAIYNFIQNMETEMQKNDNRRPVLFSAISPIVIATQKLSIVWCQYFGSILAFPLTQNWLSF